MNNTKQYLENLFLLVLSTLLSISIGLYAYAAYTIYQLPNSGVIIKGGHITKFDKKNGFIAKNNIKTSMAIPGANIFFEIFTDNTGARISNTIAQGLNQPPITTIGCSFTWGHGVDNNETFSSQLQKRTNIEVKNYGMGSFSGAQSLQTLQRHNTKTQLVIYGFIDDHLRRNITPCAPAFSPACLYVPTIKSRSDKFYIDKKIPSNNLGIIYEFLNKSNKRDYFSFNNIYLGYKLTINKIENLMGLQRTTLLDNERISAETYIVNKMAEQARKNNAKILVVNVGIGAPSENFNILMKQHWKKDIYFLDASKFDGISEESLLIKGDGHPNAYGHRLISEKIYDFISQNNLIPL